LRIVGKTLKKRRDQRYHSTRDLLGDLKELHEELLLEAKLEQTAVPDRPESAAKPGKAVPSTSDGSRDALLLTEFDNSTGETIFDQTLKMALAFALSQSPFLDIFPDTKVRQTLGWMGRPADERVTKELGYEICLRQGLKAFITGSISSIGSTYVLTLEALNARTGESLGRQFDQVNSKEEVLTALSQAATGLREQLGESLSSIQKYDIPVEFATTSSLEALEYFTLAYEQQNLGKTLEAIPFYKKALEYDPKFASVYSGLAVIYGNTNQWKLAAEMTEKAYALRHTVSENEKLRIVYFYHKMVTGEIDKAIDTLEVWRKTYPSHVVALVNLADSYERIGQSEKAIESARQAVRLDSNNAISYMNLAESLLSLGRLDEVKEVLLKAKEKNLDGDYFHMLPFQVAFIEGDREEMDKHILWFSGRTDEYLALDLQTGAAGFGGQWRRSQDLSRRSIDLAKRNDAYEVAAQFAAEQAIRIAFWSSSSGLPDRNDKHLASVIRTQTNKALALERSSSVLSLCALALAIIGLGAEAEPLIEELRSNTPRNTLINELWIPTIRAALELQDGKPKDVSEVLEPAERFEKEGQFFQRYIKAIAYSLTGDYHAAVFEFNKILGHRGEASLSSIYPLAQLGKARILRDKAEYEKFFEYWKDADEDMPALVAAKEEFSEFD
jgi:tetratricopeptide (TPR) repeat protein